MHGASRARYPESTVTSQDPRLPAACVDSGRERTSPPTTSGSTVTWRARVGSLQFEKWESMLDAPLAELRLRYGVAAEAMAPDPGRA